MLLGELWKFEGETVASYELLAMHSRESTSTMPDVDSGQSKQDEGKNVQWAALTQLMNTKIVSAVSSMVLVCMGKAEFKTMARAVTVYFHHFGRRGRLQHDMLIRRRCRQ